ncbi:nidogen-like domain-containing protein [Sulfitobacter mediterraneus]|uniref:Uncharacterized protein DUF4214 n=1 Tax=Sulfitobacter mediterraneus TaxID=83219 RepID=A0A2T6CAE0_9RHOB|nr:nidogen-like domain-containing protein [Sulfitobacter mediterraneus]KIN78296.1 Cadherin domain/calx-beta domain protein [Sulfitobacter mediterraneus KCTC 32188]PTX72184.1 uncharacterized protein DUF4214 [Sulfitobacter mediterraneus]
MAVPLINTLGGTTGFGGEILDRNDDSSTGEIDITGVFENGLNFFGATYNSLFVNNNGGVSFNSPLGAYTPQTISSGTTPGIFPYWADVDTEGSTGNVSPGGSSQGTNLVYYTLDAANDRFVATWDDVGYFSGNTDHVNAFQLILTDRSSTLGRTAGDFDIEFRYEWIDWTAGDASDGEGGVGGITARAGYSSGNAIFFELPQSGNEDAMLALEHTSGNTGLDGLWRWGVFNGNVPPTVSIFSAIDVMEGDSGVTELVFRVERTGDVTGTLDVEWNATGFFPSPANSGDVAGALPRSGILNFADGETVKLITIGVQGDTTIEANENIVVTLRNAVSSNGETVIFSAFQGFGRIINDDFPPPPVTGPESDVYGDPHIVTLDGLGYDFQAVGEFTLIETISGDPLNVQIRTAPISDVVSFITAVATEIGGTRVMLDVNRDIPLSINGELTALTVENGPLPIGSSGGQIYANGDTYTIIMPNGEQLMVGVFDNGSLNVCTFLSDSRAAGSVRGLLGNADGNVSNDLMLPDGTVLAQPLDFSTLYTTFADAWRITEPQALFDREIGETTNDYQDSSYPRGHIAVDDLPADIRAAAEAAVQAAGITNPVIAENAVLDFALTGDLTFVTGATMLAANPSADTDPANLPAALPTLMINSEGSHAEGNAGTSTFRFTIDRIVSTSGTLDVDYLIGGQVDSTDIDGPLGGVISFADGEAEKTIEVVINGDNTVELDETLTMSIGVATAGTVLFANRSASTIVLDDDGAVVLNGTSLADLLQGDITDNVVFALGGNDTAFGDSGDDQIYGDTGDDSLTGNSGDDYLDGGAGTDSAQYSGNQASYTLTLSPTGTSVKDRRTDGNGTDTLHDIEFLDFDTDLLGGPFDLQKFGGPAELDPAELESFVELYIAYFNRAPDAVGLNFWGTAFANGTTLSEMATLFIDQDETRESYPEGTTNNAFAVSVYSNVLGRTPDQIGIDFWVGLLDNGDVSRDQFILEVLRGAKSDLKPELGQDFVDQQIADQQFLSTKADIGAYFAVHKGMSDTDNASAAMALFDGTPESTTSAVNAIDGFYADALDAIDGEFLMPLVGVLDDPFAIT